MTVPGGKKASRGSLQTPLLRPEPSEITYKTAKFLITDRPTDQKIQEYIAELQKHGVKEVVRVCEPTYGTGAIEEKGIRVHDLMFSDGSTPPTEILSEWFSLLSNTYKAHPGSCVAVHCVAGLGRAPVLVAVALIELGMKYEDAVELIRGKRRGAINAKQLAYLQHYKPRGRLRERQSCACM
ncbi:unnamed protein product [Cyprideis torosa]|uniref:protein-tyrosine-phosphatase n=1 Tax=Cyprideis torosa TaxID=163714 RepID=A0A7R8ZRK0_9CRUS|nr:unnamed protein product [Cyprideis torosa]CAG0893331.1 unnamed protein product [Cyprideis torosa]